MTLNGSQGLGLPILSDFSRSRPQAQSDAFTMIIFPRMIPRSRLNSKPLTPDSNTLDDETPRTKPLKPTAPCLRARHLCNSNKAVIVDVELHFRVYGVKGLRFITIT